MQEQIETLQGMISYMRIYPQIKAKELAEQAMNLESSNDIQAKYVPQRLLTGFCLVLR
ncbi:hypothetical protein ACK1CN_00050 [Vibrio coralliilyticus]|uniref:hypothetical protein n=1 Tax=Vibrio coralliilyticus TaxID=190893 RepID=UPI0039172E18